MCYKKSKKRELYFRNVFKLPVRDGSLLERLALQEHVNTHQVVEALEQETSSYEAEVKQLETQQGVQTKQLKEADTRFYEAKSINDKLQDLQRKEQQQAALQAERPLIEKQEQQFKRAEQASRLLPFEQWYEEALQSEQKAEQFLNQLSSKKEQTVRAFGLAKEQYEELKGKESVREEAKRNVQKLEELQPIIASLAEKKTKLQEAEQQSAKLKVEVTKLEQQQGVNQVQKREVAGELKQLEEDLTQYVIKLEELSGMRDDAKVLKQAYDVGQEVQKYEQGKKLRLKR